MNGHPAAVKRLKVRIELVIKRASKGVPHFLRLTIYRAYSSPKSLVLNTSALPFTEQSSHHLAVLQSSWNQVTRCDSVSFHFYSAIAIINYIPVYSATNEKYLIFIARIYIVDTLLISFDGDWSYICLVCVTLPAPSNMSRQHNTWCQSMVSDCTICLCTLETGPYFEDELASEQPADPQRQAVVHLEASGARPAHHHPSSILLALKCGHVFHTQCFEAHYKSKPNTAACPTCRAPLPPLRNLNGTLFAHPPLAVHGAFTVEAMRVHLAREMEQIDVEIAESERVLALERERVLTVLTRQLGSAEAALALFDQFMGQ